MLSNYKANTTHILHHYYIRGLEAMRNLLSWAWSQQNPHENVQLSEWQATAPFICLLQLSEIHVFDGESHNSESKIC